MGPPSHPFARGLGCLFFGSHEHVLDDKGRTSLPKDFRDVLKQEPQDPWLTAGARCLVIYTAAAFDEVQARLNQGDLRDGEIIRLQRRILGNATRCRVDAQGRILVPQTLRRYAGLERDIVVAGRGTLIEIWDRDLWAAEMDRARAETV